jgi:hypothetical protein
MKALFCSTIAAGLMLVASAASAGEIKGPPPQSNLPPHSGPISNGNSFCSFSGLNDTPEGLPPVLDENGNVIEPGDPGGQVQSYGYFMAKFDAFDPSDPAQRDSFNFPGSGCKASDHPLHG